MKTNLRIVFLAPLNCVRMQNWARELIKRGHDLLYLDIPSSSESQIDPIIPWRQIPLTYRKGYLKFWLNRKVLERILRDFRADLLHAFYTTNYGVSAVRQRVCPSIVTVGGSDVLIEPARNPLFKWVNKYVFKRTKMINPVSEHLTDILKNNYGIQERTEKFPAGIDCSIFTPLNKKRSSPVKIISTRNFKPVYNHEILIQAIPELLKNHPGLQIEMLGDGPLKEQYRQKLQEFDQVQWQGWQPREILVQKLKESHIYISSSLSDGTSSSLLEAMACGVFPIVTDIPANREWIQDGINGFLIPPTSSKVLKEKIETAIQNDSLRENAKKFNADLVRKRADLKMIVTRLEKIYQNILQNTNGIDSK